MDEQGFSEFMKKANRSTGTVRRDITFMKLFEDFLSERNRTLDEAVPNDFQAFLEVVDAKYKTFSYLAAIRHYYGFTGNDRMKYAFDEIDYQGRQPYKLTRHIDINPTYVKSLATVGIKTSMELVLAGKTEQDRKILSEQTGIPYDDLLELVKLSDLSRKWGPKRARLYYDAGYDTFDKVAAMDPVVFMQSIIDYVQRTGIDYAPPTSSDASWAVEGAKRRPRLVKY